MKKTKRILIAERIGHAVNEELTNKKGENKMKHWMYYRFCETAALRLSLLDRIIKRSAYDEFIENARSGTDMSNVFKKASQAYARINLNTRRER